MSFFVISDVHGMYEEFKEIMGYWDKESKLVILGDIVDRGNDSLKVIQELIQFSKMYPSKLVYLKGNHDETFLKFIKSPRDYADIYVNQMSGDKTLQSFLGYEYGYLTYDQIKRNLIKEFAEEVQFLQSGLYVYQEGNLLFTHAGYNPSLPHWSNTSLHDFLWIRNHYDQHNKTGLINVFGHTPTLFLHSDFSVWFNYKKDFIGIDGGCAYGGQLNAMEITEEGKILKVYSVSSTLPTYVKDIKLIDIILSIQRKNHLSIKEIYRIFQLNKLDIKKFILGDIGDKGKHVISIVKNHFFGQLSPAEKKFILEF